MILAAAQLRSIAGDIEHNARRHEQFIEQAAAHGADLILFPELSLTGYEPNLAAALATNQDDPRLARFQKLSDTRAIVIGLGLPERVAWGVRIGLVLFQTRWHRTTYAKRLLHADELPYFVPGEQPLVFHARGHTLAPAICYESLQPSHAKEMAGAGADVYLASVAKSERGVAKAYEHYPAIAAEHGMIVLMANNVGPCDNFVGAGASAVWDKSGERLGQLDAASEGLLIFDTATRQVEMVLDD
jgi:predicted amidohydrolase